MALIQSALKKASRATIELAAGLSEKKRGERWLHGVLLGYLESSVGKMHSEYRVDRGRIDYRHGGNNPSVVELVVRRHGVEYAPSANKTELAKLCRIPNQQARTRYLLILDLSESTPLRKHVVQAAYRRHNSGRGRFHRECVRVMYVHPDARHDFDFSWDPYAT